MNYNNNTKQERQKPSRPQSSGASLVRPASRSSSRATTPLFNRSGQRKMSVSPVDLSKRQRSPPESDVLGRRTLEAQCPRTRTYECLKTKRSASASPSDDKRVLLAVKDVLSRAVFERGTIEQNDIGTILENMKHRLKKDECVGMAGTRRAIGVGLERSSRQLSPRAPADDHPERAAKPLAGIVRKSLDSSVKPPGYKRVYNRIEPADVKDNLTNKVLDDEVDTVVYIDLPNPDYSNFNSIVRKDKEMLKDGVQKKDKTESITIDGINAPDATLVNEGKVGDCRGNLGGQTFDFWKAAEEAKLQSYIESIIRSMHEQMNGKQPDDSTCVCKKDASGMNVMDGPKSEEKALNQSEAKLKGDIKRKKGALPDLVRTSRTRKSRITVGESNVKVLKKNNNFTPDASRISISPNVGRCEETVSGVPVQSESEEPSDEMYLKQRIRKPLVKRN